MADTAIAITAGAGTNVDTRTEATNGNHRQVVVIGDPATNAGVAPVDVTAGLKVDLGADNDVTVTSGTINIGAALPAGANTIGTVTLTANGAVNVAQMNGVTVTMGNGGSGTGVQRVAIASDNTAIVGAGGGATGAAVPSVAAYTGLRAASSLPTAATAGNTVGAHADRYGRQVVNCVTMRDLIGTQTTTISASTTETTIVTAAASTFKDLMLLVVSNTSAATTTRIDFRDTTAGTILFSLISVGGQGPVGFSMGGVIIPQSAVNTNWTAQCATSTTDIRIYAVFANNI